LSKNSFVNVKVFDALGNETANLIFGNKPQGNYDVTWDASGFSGGVYFYRLEIDGYIIDT